MPQFLQHWCLQAAYLLVSPSGISQKGLSTNILKLFSLTLLIGRLWEIPENYERAHSLEVQDFI
jgi:hypothetical protein